MARTNFATQVCVAYPRARTARSTEASETIVPGEVTHTCATREIPKPQRYARKARLWKYRRPRTRSVRKDPADPKDRSPEHGRAYMARITVTQLKHASLDKKWRDAWILDPSIPVPIVRAPKNSVRVNSSLFHRLVDQFSNWLTAESNLRIAVKLFRYEDV